MDPRKGKELFGAVLSVKHLFLTGSRTNRACNLSTSSSLGVWQLPFGLEVR